MFQRALTILLPLFRALGLFAALAVGACTQVPTTAERTASFAPYLTTVVPDPQLGDVHLRDYLYVRTAILIHHAVVSPDPANPAHVRFGPTAGYKGQTFGLTVAVDTRGYFLTADHCLDDTEPTLVVYDGAASRAYVPRVVWRGGHRSGEPDLALVHIDGPVPHVFTWADSFSPDDSVVAVGPNYDRKPTGFLIDCLAGKLLEASGPTTQTFRWIQHTTALHPGDSGGPLTTVDGRLIAINTTAVWRRPWFSAKTTWTGCSVRPDLAWLQKMIGDDVAAQSSPTETSTSPAT